MSRQLRSNSVCICLAVFFLISITSVQAEVFTGHYVGGDIPDRLLVGSTVFNGSDSLYLNGRLLIHGQDYKFPAGAQYIDLANLNISENDTLEVVYHRLPPWFPTTFGNPLTEPSADSDVPSLSGTAGRPVGVSRGSNVSLSGAKSFRFSARSAGSSEFGQSLDLSITGELSPGLEITGAITDRGFDPAYGTANSRLSELDKVNVQIKSRRVDGRLGDIVLTGLPGLQRPKNVSGVLLNLEYPRWHMGAAAARPRGRFETYSFLGRDGLQGPYQVGSGGRALPIVPGSETVWLDGEQLERGSDRDYTVEYATGRITFAVTRPIDGRSRIEIDYEPQTTDYEKELFTMGGGVHLADSSFFVSVSALREGDDSEQPLLGEFSDLEKSLLASAGDSSVAVPGGVPDTLGNYVLVTDSLPDTVWQYVGGGNGDHSVTFTFAGAGRGEYQLVGSGNYVFVGPGLGDYQPIRRLPAPSRVDEYRLKAGVHNRVVGRVTADFRQTRFDRNLLSDLDDGDNDGLYYDFRLARPWSVDSDRGGLTVRNRIRQANYLGRERNDSADFTRDYLLPEGFVPTTDETLREFGAELESSQKVRLAPSYKRLEYSRFFAVDVGAVEAGVSPLKDLLLDTRWRRASSSLDTSSARGDGESDNYQGRLTYQPGSNTRYTAAVEHDRRRLAYDSTVDGARYDRVRLEAARGGENIQWEYYAEDSLFEGWSSVLERNRLSVGSNRRLGDLSYEALAAYQWLARTDADETSFLGRLNLRYSSLARRLSVATAYTVSEEERNARGVTYLEVEPGEGNFIFEGGEYVPDPDGNFIRVDEILSATDHVRRGQKSFQLTKDWSSVRLRFDSHIEEELLDEGKRGGWWVVPFWSDDSQPYLYFNRRYNGDVRALPLGGAHAIAVRLRHDTEIRQVGGVARLNRKVTGELALKQAPGRLFVEEAMSLFDTERDSYYSGSGNIDGYKLRLTVTGPVAGGEMSAGGYYRRAEAVDAASSELFGVKAGSRFRLLGQGELRTDLELYRQNLDDPNGTASYELTDNRPGSRGGIWSLSLRYGVRKGLRVNFSLSGKHSDDRTARIVSRGEVVAGF